MSFRDSSCLYLPSTGFITLYKWVVMLGIELGSSGSPAKPFITGPIIPASCNRFLTVKESKWTVCTQRHCNLIGQLTETENSFSGSEQNGRLLHTSNLASRTHSHSHSLQSGPRPPIFSLLVGRTHPISSFKPNLRWIEMVLVLPLPLIES